MFSCCTNHAPNDDAVLIWTQIANIHWIMEKASEFQKNIYFCFIDYTKALDCVDRNKLWKINALNRIQKWDA